MTVQEVVTPVQEITQEAEPIQVQQASITPRSTIEAKIRAKFGVNGDAMIKIAICESSMDPNKVNPGTVAIPEHSVGLFQINIQSFNDPKPTEESLKDVDTNLEYAYQKFKSQGWGAWFSCSKII